MTVSTGNEALGVLLEKYIKDLFDTMPPIGAYCGVHEYDGRLPDMSLAAATKRAESLKVLKGSAQAIELDPADKESEFDRTLLMRCIDKELFEFEELRELERNPISYGFLADVSAYIKREYAPLEERLDMVIRHLEQLPQALAQGLQNLEISLSRPALETALEVYRGNIAYLENDVAAQFKQAGNSVLSARYTAVLQKSVEALNNFLMELEKRLPLSHNNFAIGAERYRNMLKYGEMVDMSVEELLEVGRRNLQENQALLQEVARIFAPGRPVKEVMSEMVKNHPTPESFVPDTVAKLEEVRQFLIDHDIVSVPSEIRCIVAETPPFMRWAFAFMDTPGPYEQVATQSYYYLTPVEENWTEQQKEEWLTKFDYYTLQDVSVHEAYPGHYLHFLHFKLLNNRFRQLLWGANYSYSFVEGWAHYTEQMMIEAGYGAEDPRYQMAQLAEALLRNCRYVVSILMHTQGMTVQEATRFFMDNAYMEETPSISEARRGTFDPGYLNYTLGKLLILKLKEDYKKEKGSAFSQREFHDRILAYGAPPVPLIRRMLLSHDDGKLL